MKYANSLFSKSGLYERYGENPGKMLVHTGILGWFLSSLAQITAVIANDKISQEQKNFLIPQEAADGAINILSFYFITSSIKLLASKLVSCGKMSTKAIKTFLKNNNIDNKIGKLDFNIEKLNNFQDIKGKYKPFKNGVDVIASTIGSIISCNIVTPVLRNEFASRRQKYLTEKMKKNSDIKYPASISMDDYQKMAYSKYSSGHLKI